MTDTDTDLVDLSSEEDRYEWLKAQIMEMQRQQHESGTVVADPTWLDRAMGLFTSQVSIAWGDTNEDDSEEDED